MSTAITELVSRGHLGPVLALHGGKEALWFGCGRRVLREDGSEFVRIPDGETVHQIEWCEGEGEGGGLLGVSSAYAVYIFDAFGDRLGQAAGSELVLCLRWMDQSVLLVARSRGVVETVERVSEVGEWMTQRRSVCDENGVLWSADLHIEQNPPSITAAMGTFMGQILLWNPQLDSGGQHVTTARSCGHRGPVFALKFSHLGQFLVSGGDDRTVRLWRISECDGLRGLEQIRAFWSHTARVWDVTFAGPHPETAVNDNFTLVSAAEDRSCRIWDEDGLVATLLGHEGRSVRRVTTVNSHMGERIVTAGDDSKLLSSSLPSRNSGSLTARPLHFPAEDRGSGNCEAVRGILICSTELAIVSTDFGKLWTVSLDAGATDPWKLRHTSEVHRYSPNSIVSSTKWNVLAVGTAAGKVALFEYESLRVGPDQPVLQFQVLETPFRGLVMGLYFDDWDGSIYLSDAHGCLYQYAIETTSSPSQWRLRAVLKASNWVVTYAAFTSDRIIVGDRKGRIFAYNRISKELSKHANAESSVVKDCVPVSTVKAHTDRVGQIVADPILDMLVSCAADGTVASLSVDGEKILWRSKSHEGVNNLDKLFLVNGEIFAAGFRSVMFYLWNLTSRVEMSAVACGGFRRPHDTYAVNNNPNEAFLFSFWKVSDMFLYASLPVSNTIPSRSVILGRDFHGSRANDVCFTRDDQVVTVSEDTVAKVLEVRSQDPLLSRVQTLQEHISGIHAVAYDEVEDLLFTGGGKNELMCWSASKQGLFSLRTRMRSSGAKHNPKAALRVTSLAIVAPGLLLVGRSDGSVSTATVQDAKIVEGVSHVGHHRGAVKALAPVPNEPYLLSGDTSGLICVWRVQSLTDMVPLYNFQAHSLGANGLSVRRIGEQRVLFSCGDDQSVALWRWTESTAELIARDDGAHGAAVVSVAAVPAQEDGFLTVGADRKVRFWRVESVLWESSKKTGLKPYQTTYTSVYDPASISMRGDVAVVVGLGIETIQFE